MKKFLLSFLTIAAMSSMAFAETATLDFQNWEFPGADSWGEKYEKHIVTFESATVTFESADKQRPGNDIDDCPVTKGQPVTVVLNNMENNITAVTFNLKQWGSKKQTATLLTSADGSVFTETETTSDNFKLTSSSLPEGTKGVKVEFSSQSNQVGISSIVITYESGSGEVVVSAPQFSPAGGTYYEAQSVTLSTATDGAAIYYTINGDEPSETSTKYEAPIAVSETTTIKAIAIKDDVKSMVVEATYTIADLFYNEDFSKTNGDFTLIKVSGDDAVTGWAWEQNYGGQLEASAYIDNTNYAAELWAVSPEIDLTAAAEATLQFEEVINYIGNRNINDACVVKISSDYTGDVKAATWTTLEVTGRPQGTSYDEKVVDPINLSDFVGKKIRLGFQYISTTEKAQTWQIAEITISGKKSGTPSGVAGVAAEGAVKVLGLDGEIAIVGEAADVEVYNMGGALIAKGNLERVSCPQGIYVVKVDGNVQKVIVK